MSSYAPRPELILIADLVQGLHAKARSLGYDDLRQARDAARSLAKLAKRPKTARDDGLRTALRGRLEDLQYLRSVACLDLQIPEVIGQEQSSTLEQICQAVRRVVEWVLGPTERLIEDALSQMDSDEDVDYRALSELHFRGSREVLEAARDLCASQDDRKRELGANILSQLGVPKAAYPDECFEILADLLAHETHPDVLNAIGNAFGFLHNPKAIALMAPFVDHPEWQVRFGVVQALSSHEDDRAIELLYRLMKDEDEVIRDWATFGLGSLNDADSPVVRDALADHLTDSDPIVRAEALVGLARRGDARSLDALLREMQSNEFLTEAKRYIYEAADELKEHGMFGKLIEALKSLSWPEQSLQHLIVNELISENTDDAKSV